MTRSAVMPRSWASGATIRRWASTGTARRLTSSAMTNGRPSAAASVWAARSRPIEPRGLAPRRTSAVWRVACTSPTTYWTICGSVRTLALTVIIRSISSSSSTGSSGPGAPPWRAVTMPASAAASG